MEHESDGDINFNWCIQYSQQRVNTVTGGFKNKRTSKGHQDYSIIEIGQDVI